LILNTLTSTIQYLEQKFLPNKIRNYQERYEFVIGKTILHYKIQEKLGEGGMGVVYKAEDTKLERTVAIKFLPRHIASNKDERTIHNIEEVGGEIFIVMEYIQGQELKEIVQSEIPNLQSAIDYATQIASGLQAAHKKGVIHRDIKSSNIMITDEDQVKIMDFGLAKVRGGAEVTKVGTTLGTAAYMSPEQAKGEEADQRSDIWSFGVVLYEMLTGHLPFKGDYEQAVTYAILNEERELADDIPSTLQQILQKALVKDLSKRFQNVGEVLTDLKSNVEGPISVVTRPVVSKGSVPLQRKRVVLYTSIGIVTLILVITLAYFFTRSQPMDSIAVLPFVNSNNNPDLEYLSDGLTETLINKLSQLPQLRVMARSTVFHYKGQGVNPLEVGRDLGVNAVLTGNIVQRGELLRLQAELVDILDGTQIWGAQYNPSFDDIFSVQDAISEQIIRSLRLKLTRDEKNRIARRHTEDTEAYQLYLKGRFYWNKRTAEAFNTAIDYFQQAVEHDPNYALAYAGMADCYALFNIYGIAPAKKSLPRSKTMALKALEIYPQLGEAHVTLGWVKALFDWDWTAAEESFKRGIELNPNYATAYHWYGVMLIALGRVNEAIEQSKQALQLDPLSLIINADLGDWFTQAKKYNLAFEQLHKALDMDPMFHVTHLHLARAYLAIGNPDKSIEHAKRAVKLENDPRGLHRLALAYAAVGKKEEALQTVVDLEELSKERPVDATIFARIYAWLGDKDKALDFLEQAVEEQSAWIAFWHPVIMDPFPIKDLLLADPRFKEITRKVGWPE
jgi:serine/threonine-protein kinase